jgi:hypothetical protein
LQQLLANRQQGFAPAVGQEAKKADAEEAVREHMEKKAAQKLFRRYCHELLFGITIEGTNGRPVPSQVAEDWLGKLTVSSEKLASVRP